MIKLVPNWKTILWKTWSMRFTYLGVIVTWGIAFAIRAYGDIPISPFATLLLTSLIIPAAAVFGRIVDQHIANPKE